VLINRTPQIVQHAPDADEHLIKVPSVTGLRPSAAQPSGEVGTELLAPVPNAFVGHPYATLGQDQLNVTQAEAEDVIQPDGVADDFGRKPVSAIGGGLANHAVSLACLLPERQPRLTCRCRAPACPLIGLNVPEPEPPVATCST
jgi:hypothetical protein